MRFPGSPISFRMAAAILLSGLVCLVVIAIVRRLRRALIQTEPLEEARPRQEQLPLHTYHAVIQELKQQKHELQSTQQAEKRRAKTSENISAAVLSHLSSGVMFLQSNGIVRQANTAAKNILGFASLVGMSASEVFRDAALASDDDSRQLLADAVRSRLQEKSPFRSWQAHYVTPSGHHRILGVTLSFVRDASSEVVGAACLIDDHTELAQMQHQQQLRGEMSAEMALELRASVATISDYARQLAAGRDPGQTQQLAADIISEAAHLDRTIGGFLAEPRAMARAAGS